MIGFFVAHEITHGKIFFSCFYFCRLLNYKFNFEKKGFDSYGRHFNDNGIYNRNSLSLWTNRYFLSPLRIYIFFWNKVKMFSFFSLFEQQQHCEKFYNEIEMFDQSVWQLFNRWSDECEWLFDSNREHSWQWRPKAKL